jgi:4-hydroxy-tetrahydrodipicolinate synthase
VCRRIESDACARPCPMPPPPVQRYLSAAVATPLAPDLRPDAARLAGHARRLFAQGVDGITLFGTTGEGPGFSMRDRMATLEALVAGGISPERIIVAVGALAIEDSIALARHATRQGVRACLLMTPCLFRSGLTEDGIAAFYRAFLEATPRSCGAWSPPTPTGSSGSRTVAPTST